jgi:hypothetical protein
MIYVSKGKKLGRRTMRRERKVWAGVFLLVITLSLGIYYAWAAEPGNDGAGYYPLKEGNKWVYKETFYDGKAVPHMEQVLSVEKDNVRLGITRDGQPFAEVHYQLGKDGVFKTQVISAYGVDASKPYQKVLPAKISAGYTWNWESDDKKAKETARVVGFEKVTVPAGTFGAVLIQYDGTIDNEPAYSEKTWFVKGVGYVKNVSVVKGETTTLEMTDYKLTK